MVTVFKKELRSYFTSMIGFVFIAFFLVIIGIYFLVINLMQQVANFTYVLDGVTFLFVLLIPILTMRIMAEENRQKTDQLLYTSPVSVTQIVLGKFFAVISLFGIAMLIVCIYPLIMRTFGEVDLALAYSSVVGFFLMGSAYIAIGLFISSLSESQVIAAVISFVVMLITYLMTGLASMLPTDNLSVWIMVAIMVLIICVIMYLMINHILVTVALGVILEAVFAVLYIVRPSFYDGLIVNILSWFSVVDRYESFRIGVLDVAALIYYISVAFVFIFLAVQKIKKKRWS